MKKSSARQNAIETEKRVHKENFSEKARQLKSLCSPGLSVETIRSRLYRGWTDEQIIARDEHYNPPPKKTHPWKAGSYEIMLQKKEREHRKKRRHD